MKIKLLLLTLLITINNYSQTSIYDYIVKTNNDTITGYYSDSKFIDLNNNSHKVTPENVIIIKHRDILYSLRDKNSDTLNDSIIYLEVNSYSINPLKGWKPYLYGAQLKNEQVQDYAIKKNLDTIYGQIIVGTFGGYKLIDNSGKKLKINTKKIKEFRKDGFHYYNRKKRRVKPGDKKYGFLKLLIDDKVKLFEYSVLTWSGDIGISTEGDVSMGLIGEANYESHYYIERNEKFDLVNSNRFYHIINRFLPENKKLLNKIRLGEFDLRHIYYVIKFFNENQK